METDRLEEQFKGIREEIAAVHREVQAIRRLCERILATEHYLGAEVRRADELPLGSEARGDEVPMSAVFPGGERP